jgi:CheY-like chemotaxis protein
MASILVVDDDQPAAELFAAILRHLGYHATSTCSGPQALEHIGTAMPDLVILDMMMPDMNGLEVLKRLRTDEKTAKVPVVMFSALDDDEWRERAAVAGANDYWIKGGFDAGELEERVRSRLPA